MKATYSLIFILLIGLISSCTEDNSTLDINNIPSVVVDTTGVSQLSVYQFENLVVNPDISTQGQSESDLSYEWRLNVSPNDTTYFVIGEERNLDYEVRLRPNESNYYYQLVFTVTDQSTQLKYITAWPLTVKNNLGEGLVVAETVGESQTDLSLIMSPEVTSGYDKVKVLHNIFSANNDGSYLSGLVKQMRFTTVYGTNALLTITNNSFSQINTFDYTFGGENGDLFFAHDATFSPQLLGGVNQGDIYVGEGILTSTWMAISKKFGLPFDFSYKVPNKVAINGVGNVPVAINFYDEVNEQFIYLPSVSSFADHSMHPYEPVTDKAFNPSSVPNMVNVAAATNLDGDFLHVLKNKSTGKLALYVLDGGVSGYPSPTAPSPKSLFDLSSAPDIDNATKFVLLDNQKVMFYATSTKIYAMLFGTSVPTFEERYTAPAGEEITTLQVYTQAGYPTSSADISTNDKQLVMSTFGSEGKVYLLPFVNLGAANIDMDNIKTFEGFGRITAIIAQK